tara:strand:- start:22 stop:1137 length:1116 start_codon:yes stop_codon:yes gene_type:complete
MVVLSNTILILNYLKLMKRKEFKLNLFLTFFSVFIFLILINYILFISTKQIHQKNISKNTLTNLPIELTYLYSDTYNNLENITVILGDSHAFGSGDAFLNDDYDYSIGHFLYNYFKKKQNFLNIGAPGAGSKKIYNNYLNFRKKLNIKPNKIIYLFYEGNDLEGNILYENNYNLSRKIIIKIKYYFPLIVITRNLLKNLKSRIENKINKTENINFIKNKFLNQINFKDNIKILNFSIQSPPIELNVNDLNKSLNIFFETMINIKKDTKDIILVYLPAPTSTLNLENPIYFQKYFNQITPDSVTKEELEKLSKYIRFKIKNFSSKQNIKFLDTTEILKKKSLDLMIYGPNDYKHFNKYGYEIISNQIYENYQ